MKLQIVKKGILLLGMVVVSVMSFGQDIPDSTRQGQKSEFIVTQTMNAVVRLEAKAIARIRLEGIMPEISLNIYEVESGTLISDYRRIKEYVLFPSLSLNRTYHVYQFLQDGSEHLVAEISTLNQKDENIRVSSELAASLEKWTQIETTEQPRALDYIAQDNSLDYVERLFYLQRFYDSDQIFGEDWGFGIGNDPPDWGELHGPDKLDPNLIPLFVEKDEDEEEDGLDSKCKCKYVLNIEKIISPGTPNPIIKKNNYSWVNHSREYFNEGPNVYTHLEQWDNGPAKRQLYYIKNKKVGLGTKNRSTGNLVSTGGASINKSELFWHLVCDKSVSGIAVPEECLCEKDLTISYRYDAKIVTKAESISCLLCDKKGSAMSIEDWATVVVKKGDKVTVLDAAKHQSKSSCDEVGALSYVTDVTDFVSKLGAVLFPGSGSVSVSSSVSSSSASNNFPTRTFSTSTSNNTPTGVAKKITGIAGVINAAAKIFSTPDGSCGSSGITATWPVLLDNSITIKLKANEPVTVTMFSAHEFQASAKRSGEAWGELTTNYFLSGTITTNKTQNELDYCCIKKIGAFNLGTYLEAPLTLVPLQNTLGYELGKVGPWFAPYDKWNSLSWNSSDIIVPFEVDDLEGFTGCDDVKVVTRTIRNNKNNYLEDLSAKFTNENSIVISENKKEEVIWYNFYDMFGKEILSGSFSEREVVVSNIELNGIRKGTYVLVLYSKNKLNRRAIRFSKL
ncbi:MAG: hypothetical protein COA58_07775 [Bacteroidetes bacterium]|nr:MAG: hypothetical protein COA58_07775 [Bacteroidota bacterium]